MNSIEKRTDSRAGRFYGKLPEEIVFDILSRLPIKSLKRFECTSRSWSTHFKTQHFIANHLRHFKQPCLLLQYESGSYGPGRRKLCFLRKESLVLEPASFELFPEFDIMGSCNGILCLASNLRSGYRTKPALLLWNPAIGQIRRLPPCGTCLQLGCKYHSTGFFRDSVSNGYKVMLLHYVDKEFDFDDAFVVCDVYSSVLDSWSKSCVRYLKNVNFIDLRSVSLPGWLFWGAQELYDDVLYISFGIVLAFDLHRNVLEKIQIPEFAQVHNSNKICIHEETLALVSIWSRSSDVCLQMWILRDASVGMGEGSPWNLVFSIVEPVPFRYCALGSIVSEVYPLALYGDEIILYSENDGCGLFLFNYKTAEVRRVSTLVSGALTCCTLNHVESLIPVSADGFKGQN